MSWEQRTKFIFLKMAKSSRFYQYRFHDKWYDKFRPMRYSFTRTFETKETNLNGDATGHHLVLLNPDFKVKDLNVVEWAKETITVGRCELYFDVFRDKYPEWDKEGYRNHDLVPGEEVRTFTLTAKFSQKSHAVMFKMLVGNG